MQIELVNQPWDADADIHLEPAMQADPLDGVELLKRLVESRTAALIAVMVDGERVGSAILRIEDHDYGREAVIVAAGTPGCDRMNLCMALMNKFADLAFQIFGCDSARFHTTHETLGRLALRKGWHEAERVYRLTSREAR